MSKILTRMGDGSPLEMTEAELQGDLEDGAAQAVENGGAPELGPEEIEYLMDLFKRPDRIVGVPAGREVILSYDADALKIKRRSLFEDRVNALAIYERLGGADTLELCHADYSYRQLRPIVSYEQNALEEALANTHAPIFYGARPNLGLYTQPNGPFPNPMELLPLGRIKEGRESYEGMAGSAVEDISFIAEAMWESGADAINLDTIGASGDPDFMASLTAVEKLTRKYPEMPIEVGMAGEFVLGMHGEMFYDGTRLAGLYPLDQLKLAEKAGATIFGPAVNTNNNESVPWNLARTIALIKPCSEAAKIPVHASLGLGVGGVPMTDYPPVDAVSRVSKALVELCRLDGLWVGAGDPVGLAVAQAEASGMGGLRTAGDLVARVQLAKKLRIDDAKKYVADKLKVGAGELSDPVIMSEVRAGLGFGSLMPLGGAPKGLECKFNIARVLDLKINCLDRFKERAGL